MFWFDFDSGAPREKPKPTVTSGKNPTRVSWSRESSPLTESAPENSPPVTPSPTKSLDMSRLQRHTSELNRRQPTPIAKTLRGDHVSSDSVSALSSPGRGSREAFSSPIKPSRTKVLNQGRSSKEIAETRSALNSPSRKAGLAGRMMSRSKTESSLQDASPSPKRLGPSNSLPAFLDQTDGVPRLLPIESNRAGSSPVKESLDVGTSQRVPVHKRTYASTRSYLAPLTMAPQGTKPSIKKEESNDDLDEESTRESYADLTTRWGLDIEVLPLLIFYTRKFSSLVNRNLFMMSWF